MGIYINPGTASFEEAINSEIFVDKTKIVSVVNEVVCTKKKYVCVSRPRRFGKTTAQQILCAYFSKNCDSRPIFEDTKLSEVEGWDRYLNKFHVVRIDCNEFASFINKTGEFSFINQMTKNVRNEFIELFPDIDFSDKLRICDCIRTVYAKTGDKFVIIFDEYDLGVRVGQRAELHQEYLDYLISLFKNSAMDPAIALAYMTGILPIVKDKFESKLNNFDSITIIVPGPYAEYTGFTKAEVKSLCDEFGVDYEDCRRWYDGYKVGDFHIYNPNAIVECIRKKQFQSYWSATGSYETVSTYIDMNLDGIKDDIINMIMGQRVYVDVSGFQNTIDSIETKDDVYTYLIHLGYLSYDAEEEQCYIPNKEVQREWMQAVKRSVNFAPVAKFINNSRQLLDATINMNAEMVAYSIKETHKLVCSNLNFNNEQAYQSAIILAYFYANSKYTIIPELPTGKGFADVVLVPYVPNLPAIIIELKKDASTETALSQIKNKEYSTHLAHYHGNLLFVGINYDSDKEHECVIERFVKE